KTLNRVIAFVAEHQQIIVLLEVRLEKQACNYEKNNSHPPVPIVHIPGTAALGRFEGLLGFHRRRHEPGLAAARFAPHDERRLRWTWGESLLNRTPPGRGRRRAVYDNCQPSQQLSLPYSEWVMAAMAWTAGAAARIVNATYAPDSELVAQRAGADDRGLPGARGVRPRDHAGAHRGRDYRFRERHAGAVPEDHHLPVDSVDAGHFLVRHQRHHAGDRLRPAAAQLRGCHLWLSVYRRNHS